MSRTLVPCGQLCDHLNTNNVGNVSEVQVECIRGFRTLRNTNHTLDYDMFVTQTHGTWVVKNRKEEPKESATRAKLKKQIQK